MSKRLTIQASGNSYFQSYKCDHCGSAMVLASGSKAPYCTHCCQPLEKGTPVSRAELTASPEKPLIYVKCVSCDTVFAADGTSETAEDFAASKYCPDCAGDSLVACDQTGATLEGGDDGEDGDGDGDGLDPENMDDGEGSEDGDGDGEGKDPDSVLADNGDGEGGSDYSELDASTHADLQWSALDTNAGEATAMVAASIHTGNPIAIFRKENAPTSMQPLFAQPLFVSAFSEVAEKEGMASAVKAFGGSYFSEKALTPADIEQAALAKLQATAIPRLIDCCQIAVEGGSKGIYPEVYSALHRSLVNELVASGVDSERAVSAVSNTLSVHGSDMFGTIMAKAMELFTKTDAARVEAKALIQQASGSAVLTASENFNTRKKMEKPTLNFGVLNVTASAKPGGVDLDTMRKNLF